MRRAPQRSDAGGDAGKWVGAARPGVAHRRGRRVLLVIGVQDKNPVHRPRQDRVDLVFLARHRPGHVQEILGVAQRVLRIDEGLSGRILERHGRDRRHLGDQTIGRDHPLIGVMDVGRIVIKGRESADHPAQHRHRMRIAAEAAEEGRQLLMHHRVMGDVIDELFLLLGGRQLAVKQQVGDFEKIALVRQFLDRITAVEQHPFVAVDIGDARATGGGRHEPGIVGEVPGLRIELADIDDARTDRSAHHRKLDRLPGFVVGQCHRSGHHVVAVHRIHLCLLRPRAVAGFGRKIGLSAAIGKPAASACRCEIDSIGDPAQGLLTPQHLHHLEDPGRGRRAGQRGAQRLRHRRRA